MCCLEVEVWLFLKREIKILLKCTETELSTYVKWVWVQKDREKEKEKEKEAKIIKSILTYFVLES